MFYKIQNPQTGKWVDVKGRTGKNILNNYIQIQNGGNRRIRYARSKRGRVGSISWNEGKDDGLNLRQHIKSRSSCYKKCREQCKIHCNNKSNQGSHQLSISTPDYLRDLSLRVRH